MFTLDHVFVVFPPGAGGNFLAGLIDSLIKGNLDTLNMSSSGSAHNVSGLTSIALGSSREENMNLSDEERKAKYISLIESEFPSPIRSVAWSHDFTNIPLYKELFPNSKTLCITALTEEEKLLTLLQHINKIILTDESDVPLDQDIWQGLKTRLKARIYEELSAEVGPFDIEALYEQRQDEYRPLVEYYALNIMRGYVNILNPKNIKELIESSDVKLAYNYLMYDRLDLLILGISDAIGRDLVRDEILFVAEEYEKYRNKQNLDMVMSPSMYVKQLEEQARENLNDLRLAIAADLL